MSACDFFLNEKVFSPLSISFNLNFDFDLAVSIVTALYNEQDSVRQLTANLDKLKEDESEDYEFVWVNDGSNDKTLEALLEASKSFRATIISHDTNKGFGAALRTGIAHASGDIIVCYDADSTYPVEDIKKMISMVREGWDVVSANPFDHSRVLAEVPFWRQMLTWANAWMYKLVLGKGSNQVTIFSCAFRAYKSSVIKSISFDSNGFGAASEILGRIIMKGYRVVEAPSTLTTREHGESKMRPLKAIREHLKNLTLFLKIRLTK